MNFTIDPAARRLGADLRSRLVVFFPDGTNQRFSFQQLILGQPIEGSRIRITNGRLLVGANEQSCVKVIRPVWIEGSKPFGTSIVPTGVAATDNIFVVNPNPDHPWWFCGLSNLYVGDPSNGQVSGQHTILLLTNQPGQQLPLYNLEYVFLGEPQGNNRSVWHLNNGVANINGGWYCGGIKDSAIRGPIVLEDSGDSLWFYRNVVSGKGHYDIRQVPGASLISIVDNNINSRRWLVMRRGHRLRFVGNNCEQEVDDSANSVSPFNFTNPDGVHNGGWITNNLFSCFGASKAQTILDLNNCVGTYVGNNVLLSGGLTGNPSTGIRIGAGAVATRVGPNLFNAAVTQPVQDNGVGTMGVKRPFPTLNGWTAVSGYESTLYKCSHSGLVTLNVSIGSGTTTDGTVIGQLNPDHYAPSNEVVCVGVNAAGGTVVISIMPNGNVIGRSGLNATRVSFSVSFPSKTLANFFVGE